MTDFLVTLILKLEKTSQTAWDVECGVEKCIIKEFSDPYGDKAEVKTITVKTIGE